MNVKLVIITVVLLAITGCASQQSKYKLVKQEDTIMAYTRFIERYPNSEYQEVALSRIDELEILEEQHRLVFEEQQREQRLIELKLANEEKEENERKLIARRIAREEEKRLDKLKRKEFRANYNMIVGKSTVEDMIVRYDFATCRDDSFGILGYTGEGPERVIDADTRRIRNHYNDYTFFIGYHKGVVPDPFLLSNLRMNLAGLLKGGRFVMEEDYWWEIIVSQTFNKDGVLIKAQFE